MKNTVSRCEWAEGDPLYEQYHDEDWGVPVHDDRVLFEFLVLEGAQAGLSWITILKRREGYRRVFYNFAVEKVAAMSQADIEKALKDDGIIRNKLKINSAVNNAKVFMTIQKEFGSFANYLWGFVDGKQIQNNFKELSDVPASTELSDRISKDLKIRGISFVGTTIIYAYLQAVGVVNDHVQHCRIYKRLNRHSP